MAKRYCNACGSNPLGGTQLKACCGQLGPYEVTLNVPLYGSLGSGRPKRLLPVLCQSQRWRKQIDIGPYGGLAKGMPKKLVKLPLVEPVKFFELHGTSVSVDRA